MKDMVFAILALVFAVFAGYCFYAMRAENASVMYTVVGALFALLAVACGVMFMKNKVNKAEDIHITE